MNSKNDNEYSELNNDLSIVEKDILNLRKNIINWYPFKKNANILEINENFPEMTEALKEYTNNLKTIDNIFESSENNYNKYDYIILIGLEKYNINLTDFLKFAQNHIEEDGTIIFSCNNKYGLNTYVNDCSKTNEKEENLLSKNQIERILKELNILNYKFYYALPDYRKTSVLFTDNYLPDAESIQRDFTLYQKSEILGLRSERERYKKILEDDVKLFPFFANSYLVEITNDVSPIKFVSFNNYRKDEYKIKTIMEDDFVYKYSLNYKSDCHIKDIMNNIDILKKIGIKLLDNYENYHIYSKIVSKVRSFDKVLINYIELNEKEKVKELINEYIFEITSKLLGETSDKETVFEKYYIEITPEIKNNLKFVKYGFFDLIFQNCFYIDNNFYFYDQEWFEENIPIEFIIYRSIEYLGNTSNKIDKNELFKENNILEYVDIFKRLENAIQSNIKDERIWKIHASNNITVKNLYDTSVHYLNLKLNDDEIIKAKEAEITEKTEKIQRLNKEIQILNDELSYIKNSKSWKITKPLRHFRKKLK